MEKLFKKLKILWPNLPVKTTIEKFYFYIFSWFTNRLWKII